MLKQGPTSKVIGCALAEGTELEQARPYDVVTDNPFLLRRAEKTKGEPIILTCEGSNLVVSPGYNTPKLLSASHQDKELPKGLKLPCTVNEARVALAIPPFRYITTMQDPSTAGSDDTKKLIITNRLKIILAGFLKILSDGLEQIPADDISDFAKNPEINLGVHFNVAMVNRSIALVMAHFPGFFNRLSEENETAQRQNDSLPNRQHKAEILHGKALVAETVKIFQGHLRAALAKVHPLIRGMDNVMLQAGTWHTVTGENLCITLRRS